MIRKMTKMLNKRNLLTLFLMLVMVTPLLAGDGSVAIGAAASTIKGYITNLKVLIYAVAAIVGLVGGLRIYNKWTNGDQDINKEVVGWGGACIFIVLVPTFVEAIF